MLGPRRAVHLLCHIEYALMEGRWRWRLPQAMRLKAEVNRWEKFAIGLLLAQEKTRKDETHILFWCAALLYFHVFLLDFIPQFCTNRSAFIQDRLTSPCHAGWFGKFYDISDAAYLERRTHGWALVTFFCDKHDFTKCHAKGPSLCSSSFWSIVVWYFLTLLQNAKLNTHHTRPLDGDWLQTQTFSPSKN